MLLQVTVEVDDAQDSAPRFRLRSYAGQVSEAATEGTAVSALGTASPLTVVADDADLNPTVSTTLWGRGGRGGAGPGLDSGGGARAGCWGRGQGWTLGAGPGLDAGGGARAGRWGRGQGWMLGAGPGLDAGGGAGAGLWERGGVRAGLLERGRGRTLVAGRGQGWMLVAAAGGHRAPMLNNQSVCLYCHVTSNICIHME